MRKTASNNKLKWNLLVVSSFDPSDKYLKVGMIIFVALNRPGLGWTSRSTWKQPEGDHLQQIPGPPPCLLSGSGGSRHRQNACHLWTWNVRTWGWKPVSTFYCGIIYYIYIHIRVYIYILLLHQCARIIHCFICGLRTLQFPWLCSEDGTTLFFGLSKTAPFSRSSVSWFLSHHGLHARWKSKTTWPLLCQGPLHHHQHQHQHSHYHLLFLYLVPI